MPEECQAHFDSVVIGEGEPVWERLCRDAAAGDLQPVYQAEAPADLALLPEPRVDLYLNAEDQDFAPDDYPLQTSRGCPFTCDACVLPEYLGRKIRHFPEEYILGTLRRFAAAGKRCSLTEDTALMFASGARRRFRKLLETVVLKRETENIRLSYLGTSMPLLLNLDRDIFDLVHQAGVKRFYLVGGFDPITRSAFGQGEPESIENATTCVKICQDFGIEPYLSFLIGNEDDDQGTFDRMLEFANGVKLNIAEFAIATPYPGTPMWRKMIAEDRIIDRSWKHYNDSNVVFRPAKMSAERLQQGYLYLWREFYGTRQHLRRADRELNTVQF
jgi:radical SAM superfamily enzyme YgiQ (UPF0313 family)